MLDKGLIAFIEDLLEGVFLIIVRVDELSPSRPGIFGEEVGLFLNFDLLGSFSCPKQLGPMQIPILQNVQ